MDHDERDDILRSLVRIAQQQDSINDDFREFARQHVAITTQMATAIARLDVTLEAIKQILERLNGPRRS